MELMQLGVGVFIGGGGGEGGELCVELRVVKCCNIIPDYNQHFLVLVLDVF